MRTRKRMLSLLLAVCLMAGMLPAAVYAGEVRDSGADTGGLCEHHTVHGEACGYALSQAGETVRKPG